MYRRVLVRVRLYRLQNQASIVIHIMKSGDAEPSGNILCSSATNIHLLSEYMIIHAVSPALLTKGYATYSGKARGWKSYKNRYRILCKL